MSSTRFGRWLSVLVGALLLVAGFGVVSASGLPEVATAGLPGVSAGVAAGVSDVGTAQALAAASGVRVEVLGLRSETEQVFANPSGTLTREIVQDPARVRLGSGEWADVDPSLVQAGDGSWSPRVSAVPMRFSNGGTEAFASVTRGGVKAAVGWPGVLPAPTVQGSVLTYPDVVAGVDLVVEVAGSTFTERLVVASAQAATHPLVRSPRFKTTVTGGSVRAAADGGLEFTDAAGVVVMRSPVALAWDSSGSAGSAVSRSMTPATSSMAGGSGETGPGDGDRVARMAAMVGSDGTVSLTSPAALLDAKTTVFPVAIDPSITLSPTNWAMVDASYPGVSYVNYTSADQGVGYQNASAWSQKHLFYGFNTSSLNNGKTIVSAYLRLFQTWSWSCTPGTVDAYLAGDIFSGMTWNTQTTRVYPDRLDSYSGTAGHAGCANAGGVQAEFDVTLGVRDRVAKDTTLSTFKLIGTNETIPDNWMRFAGPQNPTVTYRPKLVIEYDTPTPAPPTGEMKVPNPTACSASAPGPAVSPNDSSAQFRMYAYDPDGGSLYVKAYVYNAAGTLVSSVTTTPLTGTQTGGVAWLVSLSSTVKWGTPAVLPDGVYHWATRAVSTKMESPLSGMCYFTLDQGSPTTPLVTKVAEPTDGLYPEGTTAVQLTLSSTDAGTGVVKFKVGLNNTSTYVPSTGSATTTVSLPMSGGGPYNVLVNAIDGAGRSSPTAVAQIKRRVPLAAAKYEFNDASNPPVTLANSVTGSMGALTATGSLGWSADYFGNGAGHALTFGGGEVSTAIMDTQHAFSVGAWVKPPTSCANKTFLSQETTDTAGTVTGPAFEVGCDDQGHWVMRLGTTSSEVATLASTALADSSGWTYVNASYDGTSTMRLSLITQANLTEVTSISRTVSAPMRPMVGLFRVGAGAGASAAWTGGAVDHLFITASYLSDGTGPNPMNDIWTNANDQP